MTTRDSGPDPGPSRYAPKWTRTVGPPLESDPLREDQQASPPSPPPPSALRLREPPPPSQGRKPSGTFEGDVAIRELRERLALAPDLPPSPPPGQARGAAHRNVMRLGAMVTLAAIAAAAFVWISTPRSQAPDVASSELQAIASGDQPDAPSVGKAGGMSPAVFEPPAAATAQDLPQRLPPTSAWPQPERRDDPASPVGPATTAMAVPSPPLEAQDPLPPAPSGLGSAVPAAARPDREEVAILMARGQSYLSNGDVVSARLVFRRAAEAGDAQAALALGGTYDPVMLKGLGVIGVKADAAQARSWYQKAAELGSREAPQRVDQLARWSR